MQPLSNRTESLTDSCIRRMTRISMECGAINLSQGFPDFDPPQAIMDRLAAVAQQGPHQYSPTWGAANYRRALNGAFEGPMRFYAVSLEFPDLFSNKAFRFSL